MKKMIILLGFICLLTLGGCATNSCKTVAKVICTQNGYTNYTSNIGFNQQKMDNRCEIECYDITMSGSFGFDGRVRDDL